MPQMTRKALYERSNPGADTSGMSFSQDMIDDPAGPPAPSTILKPAQSGFPGGASSTSLQPVGQQNPPVATQGLQQANKPALTDYIAEAQKLGNQLFKSQADQLQIANKGMGEDLSREIFGKNVGGTSGIGQDIINRSLAEQNQRLEPLAAENAASMGQTALGQQFSQNERESGQGWQSVESALNRETQVEESRLGRKLTVDESDLARKFAEKENKAGRDFSREEAQAVRTEIKNNQLWDKYQRGEWTGAEADQAMGQYLGVKNVSGFAIPNQRDTAINNMVDAFIAKGETVDYSKLNIWLQAKGMQPVSKEEVAVASGIKSVLPTVNNEDTWTEKFQDRGQVKGKAKVLEGYGFELERIDDRGRRWRTNVVDNAANSNLVRKLYNAKLPDGKTNPDYNAAFKADYDAMISI